MQSPTYNRVLGLMEKRPTEDVVSDGRAVRDLLASDGWLLLSSLLNQQVEQMQHELLYKTHEHAEYTAMTGFVRGLREAHELASAVVEAADRAEAVLNAEIQETRA